MEPRCLLLCAQVSRSMRINSEALFFELTTLDLCECRANALWGAEAWGLRVPQGPAPEDTPCVLGGSALTVWAEYRIFAARSGETPAAFISEPRWAVADGRTGPQQGSAIVLHTSELLPHARRGGGCRKRIKKNVRSGVWSRFGVRVTANFAGPYRNLSWTLT